MLVRAATAALATAAAAAWLAHPHSTRHVRRLPPGIVDVVSEIHVNSATDLVGNGTTLRAAPGFQGRALIVVEGVGITLRDFTIDGTRDAIEVRTGLPSYDVPFVRFTRANGILADGARSLTIDHIRFRNIAGFAVLAARSRDVTISRVEVADSGSRNPEGRNNTTGGILFEEGSEDFRVTASVFRRIRGNGVWTHSLYTSPRNQRGLIRGNTFEEIGRDAIQAGHAVAMRIEENAGARIGYPEDVVDAIPVAIDTAGNVEASSYTGNRFSDINGKCIDLDGFHDGEVRANQCRNMANYGIVMNNTNPDMQSRNIRVVENIIDTARYGGIFVIGEHHTVARNHLLNLNTAHCGCYYLEGEPAILASGIYLGRRAERPAPAKNNLIEDNEISGYNMDTHCVGAAPGVGPNQIRDNRCRK